MKGLLTGAPPLTSDCLAPRLCSRAYCLARTSGGQTHARAVLEQRTEVEQFFLEALEQVRASGLSELTPATWFILVALLAALPRGGPQCKKNIVEERQRSYRAALAEYRVKMKRATLEQGQVALKGRAESPQGKRCEAQTCVVLLAVACRGLWL